MALFDAHARRACDRRRDGDLVFANFVDFDTLYGHRRDVAGYAAGAGSLRRPPARSCSPRCAPAICVILTADHGNDPTWRGTDHTREHVPVLAFGPKIDGRDAGHLRTYADVAQTIAAHLALPPMQAGVSFM